MNCIFCKINNGEIPTQFLGSNAGAAAFLDVKPIAKGHTLVVPKRHAETILDLDDEELAGLFTLVRDVTDKIKKSLSPDGFNIGANMHKAAGQEVEHLHIHVVPRWSDDGGGPIQMIVNKPPSESLEDILKLINK